MKLIPLTCGKQAIVDDEDFDWLSRWKWTYLAAGYAYRQVCGADGFTAYLMHRELCYSPKDVDHINGNKLDNRRSNLRVATRSQNVANTPKRPRKKGETPASRYKGVTRTRNNKWSAQIHCMGKTYCLGTFTSEHDAAQAYNFAAVKHFGDYAYLNEAA